MTLSYQFELLHTDIINLIANELPRVFNSHLFIQKFGQDNRLSIFYRDLLVRYGGDHHKAHAQLMRLVGKYAGTLGIDKTRKVPSRNIRNTVSVIQEWSN